MVMVYDMLRKRAAQPREQEKTVEYLVEQLSRFVKKMDTVLICFPEQGVGSLSCLMEQAVLMCDAIPVVWGEDHRWKNLIRLAFSSRASTIIGTPLIVLGLAKLQSFYSTPLFIRNVVLSGYPSESWMIDGIRRGFDCTPWGCLSVGVTGVVAGFSCDKIQGIHLWESKYHVQIIDQNNNPVPNGEEGEVVLSPVDAPELRYYTGENARFYGKPCPCGCTAPLLTDFHPGRTEDDPDLLALGEELQNWNSVLDCRLQKGRYGLEIEIVTLTDAVLPPLPSAAKLQIRLFDPETEEPLPYDPTQKIPQQ